MSPGNTAVPQSSDCDRVDEMLDSVLWLDAWTRSNLRDRESRPRRASMVTRAVSARRHHIQRPQSPT